MTSVSVNKGSQVLGFDYRQEARAKLFNRLFSQLVPAGIYSGAVLTRNTATTISANPTATHPTVVLIKDANADALNVTTRIEATSEMNINLDDGTNPGYANPDKPYIVFRFAWSDVENNFMDIVAVAWPEDPTATDPAFLWPTDIIVGKVLFEEETPGNWIVKTTEPFDLTRRTNVFIPDSSLAFRELRVQSPEGVGNDKKIYVTSGSINTSSGRKQVAGGHYPTATNISDTTTQGRIDIVYVDEAGSIQIEEGVPAASPVAPSYLNRKVLAEITRGPNRTDIIGTDIRQVNVTRQGMVSADEFLIKNLNDYYTENSLGNVTIEAAFDEIYELYASILAGPGISDDTVKDYHIDWGTAADQVSAGDVPTADAGGRFTATEVEGSLQEIAGAGRTTETVKQNADDIVTNASNLSTHEGLEADTVTVHGINVVTVIS